MHNDQFPSITLSVAIIALCSAVRHSAAFDHAFDKAEADHWARAAFKDIASAKEKIAVAESELKSMISALTNDRNLPRDPEAEAAAERETANG